MKNALTALVALLALAASNANATYQCAVLDPQATRPYWEMPLGKMDGKASVAGAMPVKGAKAQVEAELARYNAALPRASDYMFTFESDTGLANATEPSLYCNEPPYVLPSGQVLDANCRGSNPFWYHTQFEGWVPQGWTEQERPLLGRVAELSLKPQSGIYRLQPMESPQPAGPRVAGWLWDPGMKILGACAVRPTLVGYFNGVWNTEPEAQYSLGRMKREFGTSISGIRLEYHLFYNQTGCNTGGNKTVGCLMDLAETFAQRQQDFEQALQHRWEYFWDLAGQRDDADTSWLGQLRQQLARTAAPLFARYRSLADAMRSRAQALTAHLVEAPPTTSDAAAHLERLKEAASKDMHALLVSHSQGNLFANTAYDAFYRLNLRGLFSPPELKMIHVAPASVTRRGDYVLADTDLVIGALRAAGLQALLPNVVSTPSMDDPSGHQFVATYFDGITGPAQIVRQLITKGLDSI